jgi:hypothetical protein
MSHVNRSCYKGNKEHILNIKVDLSEVDRDRRVDQSQDHGQLRCNQVSIRPLRLLSHPSCPPDALVFYLSNYHRPPTTPSTTLLELPHSTTTPSSLKR